MNRPNSFAKFRRRGGRGKRRPVGEMNGTERKYAEQLESQRRSGEVEWFAFEAVTFRLADRTTYTPDFLVMTSDMELWCIEVKGTTTSKKTRKKSAFVEPHNIIKIKMAAELFPLRFVMVWIDKSQPDGWGRKVFNDADDETNAAPQPPAAEPDQTFDGGQLFTERKATA